MTTYTTQCVVVNGLDDMVTYAADYTPVGMTIVQAVCPNTERFLNNFTQLVVISGSEVTASEVTPATSSNISQLIYPNSLFLNNFTQLVILGTGPESEIIVGRKVVRTSNGTEMVVWKLL